MASLIRSNFNDLLTQAQKRFLHEAGQAIVTQAAELCPVDTGLLRNSLHYRLEDFDSRLGQYPGAVPDDSVRVEQPETSDTLHIGTAVAYAAKVEYGDPDNPRYPRQPYFGPAVAVMKPKLGKVMQDIVTEVLRGNA